MATQTPIQSIVAASSVASLTFSNIPQNYNDLVLVANVATTASTSQDLKIQFNSDTGTNYSRTRLYTYHVGGASWQGDIAGSLTFIGGAWSPGTNMQGGLYSSTVANIVNYSNTSMYKNVNTTMNIMGPNFADNNIVGKCFGVWRGASGSSTEAITSITVSMGSGNIAAGSTFDLYGIGSAAMTNPFAIGGTNIAYDNSYVYHVFTASGTFTPNRNLTADILVVAGGGGAGQNQSGGGGAGGLLGFTSQNLTATSYTVTVGAGGAGNPSNTASNGGDSQFGAFTLVKGGGATGNATGYSGAGQAGGSGGGGSGGYPSGAGGAGGAASPAGQGYSGGAGGAWASGTISGSGGGGGAGAAGSVGTAGSTGAGGAGGIGSSSYSSWGLATGTGHLQSGTYYYSGGGGGAGGNNSSTPGTGGAGGYGGGGLGGTGQSVSGSGMTGTGGGGGGTSSRSSVGNGTPGNGGSGLVIVRYAR